MACQGEAPGSAGPLRGRKRDLLEGGVRVPGLLEWPSMVKEGRTVTTPCSTLDYFPTVMDILGFRMAGQPEPIDGVSLLPIIAGGMPERPVPIAFESRNQVALLDNRYKLLSTDNGETYQLYDILEDQGEATDLASRMPDTVAAMKNSLGRWRASCRASLDGVDY